jgi:PASTA domain
MPDTLHVPVLGNINKTTALMGGVAAVGVTGWLIYRHNKKSSVQPTSVPATPDTGTSAYGYGQYGYGTNNGYYGYGYGPYDGASPYGPFGYGYYGVGTPEPPGTPSATTNAEWSQAAVSALTAQGVNGSTALAALGQYLLGHSVNSSQETIVEQAIAAEGYPPVPGTNGYPPAINTGGGNPGPGPGSTKATVPYVVNMSLVDAQRDISYAGLKSTFTGPKFTAGKGQVRTVVRTNPAGGAQVNKGSNVQITYKITK